MGTHAPSSSPSKYRWKAATSSREDNDALIRRITLHRGAMQVPSKVRRAAVCQVNRRSIVPENEVVILPAMTINETRLGAMNEKKFEQLAAFCVWEVENARCEALVNEQRFAACFRMDAYDRMYNLSHLAPLLLGERRPPFRSAEAVVAVAVRMHGALAFDSLLDLGG